MQGQQEERYGNMSVIVQNNEEKAAHFASIGFMDHASYYATMVLIEEIKNLRKAIESERE